MHRLGIGQRRIRMIDPGLNRPGAAAACDGVGIGRSRVQRLDRDAVVGLGGQPFQRPVLQRRPHKLEPVLAAGGRKVGGEWQIVGHRPKMPWSGGRRQCRPAQFQSKNHAFARP